jgi:hypothetical protein
MRTLLKPCHMLNSNKGSAIITVVVTMLFVASLGAALLYITYMGYKISIAQRGEKENFYACGAVMNDIKTGIQNSVTQSLAAAYTNTVKEYAKADKSYDPQAAFADEFLYQLSLSDVQINGVLSPLFQSSQTSGKTSISQYYPASLCGFVSSVTGVVTLGSNCDYSAQYGTVSESQGADGTPVSVSLKGVSVKFARDGYETVISTDITVNIPEFFAKSPLSESLNNCAIIADGGILHSSGGSASIDGDIFSGGLTVTGNGNELSFTNGNVICKGTIAVNNSGSLLYSAPKYELWADEIDVGTQSGSVSTVGTVKLSGKVYVANDLNLSGDGGSSAALSGTYFGFGNDSANSNSSSAILINGRSSKLDISNLNKLSLAGVSFINISDQSLTSDGSSSYSSSIPMGESLAVKSDQLAYLVPAECISNYATNPCLFENAVEAPDCDISAVIWGTKKLSDYIGDGKGEIKTLYPPLNSLEPHIAYVFLVFSKPEYASAYFKDYFAAYPDRISQYLQIYADISDKSSDSYFDTAGSTFYTENHESSTAKLTLIPASDTVWTDGVQARYSTMSSPLTDFIKTDAIAKLPADTELDFMKNGAVVAVVTNKASYSYSSYSDSLQLIISTGSISVNAAFNGILLAEGTVSVSANVAAAGISSITDAVSGQYTLSDFLSGAINTGSAAAVKDSWELSTLVVYENWKKA